MRVKLMLRNNLKARLLRAVTGKSQDLLAGEIGRTAAQVDQWEQGKVMPSEDDLKLVAERGAETTAEGAEELLAIYESQRKAFRRRSEGAGALVDGLAERLTRFCAETIKSLLKLPPPDHPPSAEDRQEAERQFTALARLRERPRLAVVKLTRSYQNWALLERCCAASVQEAASNLPRAAAWARLALAIAKWLPGPEPWQNRNRGYARAHWAKILEARGKRTAAAACVDQAARLWLAGDDPTGLLDPSRLPELAEALGLRASRPL